MSMCPLQLQSYLFRYTSMPQVAVHGLIGSLLCLRYDEQVEPPRHVPEPSQQRTAILSVFCRHIKRVSRPGNTGRVAELRVVKSSGITFRILQSFVHDFPVSRTATVRKRCLLQTGHQHLASQPPRILRVLPAIKIRKTHYVGA